MSSREIATLCDKEHKNVKRDIEVMAEQLELDTLKFEHIYKDSQNREQTEYLLDKETCLCLVAGYNAKLRLAIIKRWQELEQSATITDPLLLIAHMATQAYEAKQLALKQEQRLCHIEQKVDVAIAKAQAVLDDDGYFSIKGFCSLHGIKLTNSQMSSLSKKCKKAIRC
ncbi:Rha family transcriptional regulator [Moraxella sp. VT-16-12]|nr:Rha family transcriptional regulator [Moraxella sp. VT-16-12]